MAVVTVGSVIQAMASRTIIGKKGRATKTVATTDMIGEKGLTPGVAL